MLAGVRLVIAVTAPRSAAFYAGQLAALRAAGADVSFLSSPSPEVEAQCAAEGARFVAVDMARAPSPAADLAALAAMTAALRRLRPDLINAGTPKAGLLGMMAARALRIPARVHTLHGLRYEAAGGVARAALWAAQRASCAAATHVICVGAGLRARAVATHLLVPGEGIVVGDGTVNGIDLDRFAATDVTRAAGQRLRAAHGIAAATPVFGYLGRLARDKGIGDLRRAWELVAGRGAHLLLAGTVDDTDPPAAADLAALDGLPGITRLGHVDAPAFLAALDALILPTWREGFPTAPLEAAAMGLPVIATTATGCADAVVDGETGLLVPTHAPSALAAAISRYAEDPALRAAHGTAGATRVRARFGRARVHQLTIACYRAILDEPGAVAVRGSTRLP